MTETAYLDDVKKALGISLIVDAGHWHRRDAILTAARVIKDTGLGGALGHDRIMSTARFIYYGDDASEGKREYKPMARVNGTAK